MKKSHSLVPLMSCSEIEIHYKRPLFDSMPHITKPEEVDALLRQYINLNQLDLRECFWVLLLTTANRVLGIAEVGAGTSRGVTMNAKYIFQLILQSNATSFIIAHNHPSGNLNFSDADIKETQKMKKLADAMEVSLLDHFIITSESFLSMAQSGKL